MSRPAFERPPPRTRGSTPGTGGRYVEYPASPAYAGIDLLYWCQIRGLIRLPRVRGDRPYAPKGQFSRSIPLAARLRQTGIRIGTDRVGTLAALDPVTVTVAPQLLACLGLISRSRPPPSVSLMGFVPGLVLRIFASVSGMDAGTLSRYPQKYPLLSGRQQTLADKAKR